MKKKIELKIIPEPKPGTRTVIVAKVLPAFKGSGPIDLICGNCKAVIAEGIGHGQIANMVIQCPICKLYNDIPPTW